MLSIGSTQLRLRRGMALALVAPVVALAPTSIAHAASTCHGLPATIEGSNGTVTGTSGSDVIVVTGSVTEVRAEDGDDLVCLVGTSMKVAVDPGAGDDEVDAAAAGAETDAYLGAGADSFTGSRFADYVIAGTPESFGAQGDPGPDRVATGAGRDGLLVHLGGSVEADLGKGADALRFYSASGVSASRFDLGAGRDTAAFEDWWEHPGAGDTSLHVDLPRDFLVWHGVRSRLRGAENIWGAARRIVLLGDRGRNEFHAQGCNVLLKGSAGRDRLWLLSKKQDIAPESTSCHPSRLRAYGNTGADYLSGGIRHDVLIGGRGFDRAIGGPRGRDRCEAERTRGKGCE